MDTSETGREPLYKSLANGRPAGARIFRKILDSEAPPVETKANPASIKEVDMYAATQGVETPSGLGDTLRPHQEAVNMFPAA